MMWGDINMKLCVKCYKELYKNTSQLVSLSNEKEICEECGVKTYLVNKDYPGKFIFDDFVNPFEKKGQEKL